MRDHEEPLVRALLWAAGLGGDEEFRYSVDVDDLVAAIGAHRIVGRFLDRVRTAPPRMMPDTLLQAAERLNAEHLAAADQADRDIAWLMGRVADHPDWDRQPVILLKGNSASYFLDQPGARRNTTDLDLLTSDGDRYCGIMEDLGYTRRVNKACHEDGLFDTGDRFEVDLHGYFPAWCYPEEPYHATSTTSRQLRMTNWISARRLEYRTVLESSVPHPRAGAAHVRVAGLTMTAFVLCLHLFRDFVEPFLSHRLAKVRLAELCELRDLANREEFDVPYFASLMREHGGKDAVGLSCRLLAEAGGLPEKLAGLGVPQRSGYPQELGFGLLVDARTPLRDLLIRRDTFGAVFDRIGAISVRLDQAPHQVAVRSAAPADPHRAPPALRSTPTAHPGADFEFGCTVRRDAGHVVFDVEARGGLGAYLDEVALFFGNEMIHTSRDVYQSGFRELPGISDGDAVWNITQNSWRVILRVPAKTMERHAASTGRTPLLVYCARFVEQAGSDWNDFYRRCISSVCVPLVVS